MQINIINLNKKHRQSYNKWRMIQMMKIIKQKKDFFKKIGLKNVTKINKTVL